MKKVKKESVIGILVVIVIVVLIAWLYVHEKNKDNRELAKRIVALSSTGGPPETIEGLREAIALYENQIKRNVQEGAQTGVYWKILAIRLADRGMHRDALDAYERALYYNTDDPTLFFLVGESASVVSASVLGFQMNSAEEKERFANLAETAYLRALQLDPSYQKPRFALGLLYTFDLGRPADAVPLLERFLQISPGSIEAMFVLARAYFMTGNYNSSMEVYDRIINRTKDQSVKNEAQNNKEIIRNLMYE